MTTNNEREKKSNKLSKIILIVRNSELKRALASLKDKNKKERKKEKELIASCFFNYMKMVYRFKNS